LHFAKGKRNEGNGGAEEEEVTDDDEERGQFCLSVWFLAN